MLFTSYIMKYVHVNIFWKVAGTKSGDTSAVNADATSITPNVAGDLAKGTGVGRSERPQGRTLIAKRTHAPDPCKGSLFVASSHSPQMSIDRLLRPWRAVYPCPLLQLTGYVYIVENRKLH